MPERKIHIKYTTDWSVNDMEEDEIILNELSLILRNHNKSYHLVGDKIAKA